uniref:Uncharacterized protein n=1 Tax=Arundo donax TaxID=35708 RepID=A0A0A9C5M3_ARUDO
MLLSTGLSHSMQHEYIDTDLTI